MTTTEVAMEEIDVELCGKLADCGGEVVKTIIPVAGCTVEALFKSLHRQHPQLGELLSDRRIKVCVNFSIVDANASVAVGDQVALFPPVSGG